MNETVKTIIFAIAAVVVALIAVFTYPKQEDYEIPDLQGKALFAEFTDPNIAAELIINRFDEDAVEFYEFRVARDSKTGLWSIPSSSNYPADAESQMRDAATSLIDLQVLGIASEDTKDHQVYGVMEPDKQDRDTSQEGVGLLIEVKDTKGKDLAGLIVGKRVKGSDDQHFVRKPGEPPVYVVKIDPSKFPTEFEKWIERDLLKINTIDVEDVALRDYSVVRIDTLAGPRGRLDERFEADVAWNSDGSKWELGKLVDFRKGEPHPTQLLATEELNSQKLNDLKSALGNMEIVGVLPKPKGLGGDLKAGAEFLKSEENILSLIKQGFFPAGGNNGETEIRAANGEVAIGLKNGVQYVLRFGEIAREEQYAKEGQLNRYLFVSARLDNSKFPPLELEPLPGGDDKEGAETETPKKETAKDAKEPAEDGKEEADTGDAKPDEEKTDLELERERIRKENQRKQDDRDEKLKEANKKIQELNARFADWYYIIAEDEYKKIHLGRNDLIKEKDSAKEEGFGVDALRELEKEGIEKKDDSSTPPGSSFTPPTGPRR